MIIGKDCSKLYTSIWSVYVRQNTCTPVHYVQLCYMDFKLVK